jgi:hypothetical protein
LFARLLVCLFACLLVCLLVSIFFLIATFFKPDYDEQQ